MKLGKLAASKKVEKMFDVYQHASGDLTKKFSKVYVVHCEAASM